MKESISKFLYRGTAYTAAISLLFFLFVKIIGISSPVLSFTRYLIILAFGFIVSGAEFIFIVKAIPNALRYLIHFFVLAFSFFAVFLTTRSSSGDFQLRPSSIFAALIIFGLFYLLIFGAVIISKRIIKNNIKKSEKQNVKKPEYTQKFK